MKNNKLLQITLLLSASLNAIYYIYVILAQTIMPCVNFLSYYSFVSFMNYRGFFWLFVPLALSTVTVITIFSIKKDKIYFPAITNFLFIGDICLLICIVSGVADVKFQNSLIFDFIPTILLDVVLICLLSGYIKNFLKSKKT